MLNKMVSALSTILHKYKLLHITQHLNHTAITKLNQ